MAMPAPGPAAAPEPTPWHARPRSNRAI